MVKPFTIDILWSKIQMAVAGIGGWLGYFLGGMDGMMIALLVFMTLDYITGVMCAIADEKLSSAVGFKGICKKVYKHIFSRAAGCGMVLRHKITYSSTTSFRKIFFSKPPRLAAFSARTVSNSSKVYPRTFAAA